jgi:DNA-binding beta-propeller fold protein YncE
MVGCGGGKPPCFKCPPDTICLDRDAIFVANTGSSSISAFQPYDFNPGYKEGGVCGSPFRMSAPPTALAGLAPITSYLLVLSQPQKTVSKYSVDLVTSVLSGPLCTINSRYTPVAVTGTGGFVYVANAEGSVSAYGFSANGTVANEIPGSPFPAGSGPVAITAGEGPGLVYVANSQSNNISGYIVDPSTGVLTPLAGSPYPAGQGPASIVLAPIPGPNTMGPRLVLVANKLSNNVSVFSVAANGSLSPVPGSPFPVGGAPSSVTTATGIVPLMSAYVTIPALNQIAGFSIDAATGTLAPLAGSPFPGGLGPSSATVSGGGLSLYVVSTGANSMSVYSIDPTTGALTPSSGSPVPVGQSPTAVLYLVVPQ